MKTPPPGDMTIPIPISTWQKLLVASIRSRDNLEAWEIGARAVQDWLARNSPESLSMPSTCGYQWKQLFLPNGTLLRTVFGGKHYHCMVEEDGIRVDGKPSSPSGFANAVGGVRRNAWRVIWVLFPDATDWKLADSLRTTRRAPPRSARRPGAGARGIKDEPGAAQPGGRRTLADRRASGGERRRERPAPRHDDIPRDDVRPEREDTPCGAIRPHFARCFGPVPACSPVMWRLSPTLRMDTGTSAANPRAPASG